MNSRLCAIAGSTGLLLVSALLLTAVMFSGCRKSAYQAASKSNGQHAAKKPKPLLKGWEKPAFALLISGDMDGYLEPCGCTKDSQMGGLAHRADLLRKLRKEKQWDVAGLDLGGMVTYNLRNPDEDDFRQQDLVKLRHTLEALKELGYQAAGLGKRELRMLLRRHNDALTFTALTRGTTDPVPFISANAEILLEAGKPETVFGPERFRVFTIAGKKIGVTSILGKKYRGELIAKQAKTPIVIKDPKPALTDVLSKLKAENPDHLVLLSYATLDESRELAKAFPDFDLVVSAGGSGEGEKPQKVGKALLISVGKKGKKVGVVGFYPGAEDDPLRFELVELDQHRFNDDERMHALMERYQKAITRDKKAVFADARFGGLHERQTRFVGVESCAECHKAAYAVWKKSKHSRAYQSLIDGREDQKNPIPRNYDPECLACHVTGWNPKTLQRYDTGFLVKELADAKGRPQLYTHLQGQQCENCHGPGGNHVDLERQWEKKQDKSKFEPVRLARIQMQRRKEEVRKKALCTGCHDLDNSPKFDFDKYWPKIEHKGKE